MRMQANRGALLAVAVVAALVALAPMTAQAGKLATATVYAGGVDFLPGVDHAGATATVSGRTLTFQRSFAAGERLSIGLFDPDGQLLPDGTYTWRLQLVPGRAAARDLRRAARRNGGTAPDAWQALSGAFTIRDGRMADPGLRESRPARRDAAGLRAALPADLTAANRGARVADDDDAAVAAGHAPRANAVADATQAPSGRTIAERTDAAALAAGPAPARRAVTDEPSTVRRSWPTDGKNGRE